MVVVRFRGTPVLVGLSPGTAFRCVVTLGGGVLGQPGGGTPYTSGGEMTSVR